MKNESDPMAQSDKVISGLPKAQPILTYDKPNWSEPRILRQELLKAYNKGQRWRPTYSIEDPYTKPQRDPIIVYIHPPPLPNKKIYQ